MSSSTRFAVAVHVLAAIGYLEREGIERVSSRQIARSVNTNAVVIRNLLCVLKSAGLIDCKEGKGGGVKLAKNPTRISLQEIYAAVEAREIFSANSRPKQGSCPVSCGMKDVFRKVADEVEGAVLRVLRRKSLKQVIDQL